MTRWTARIGAALAGAMVAAVATAVLASLAASPEPEPSSEPAALDVDFERIRRHSSPRLLLAWSPTSTGGLPANTEQLLEATKGVEQVTVATAGLDWLIASRTADGTVLDAPPRGFRIPIEATAVRAADYERFVPLSDRAAFEGLGPGEVLLSETSAALRGADIGSILELDSGRYEVAGIVSDTAARAYEVVLPATPASWDVVDRYALVQLERGRVRVRVSRTLRGALPPGRVLRIRAKGETPYLRYGDAVMPQQMIKQSFGEFSGRPLADGTIQIDPSWVEQNIERARVPILGDVACHRTFAQQLRRALGEVRRQGLSFLIDRSQFGGCYGPRFIGKVPGGRLSHHAWGIAIDVNAADNAYGTRSDMDERLVEIMESLGFTWGGRWLIPDGMHFEWVRFP